MLPIEIGPLVGKEPPGTERESVVKWLREQSEKELGLSSAHSCALANAARAIERGEHIKIEKESE